MPLRSFVPVKKFFKLERGNHMPPEPAGSLLPPTTALLSAAPDTAAASQPAGGGALSILLLLVLILINGFFASAEIAVITLNDNKVKKMAEDGNKKAQRVLRLTENSSRFLSTIQIGVTLAGFLSSASAAPSRTPSRRKRGPNICSKTPFASRRRGWKSALRSWSVRYWAA